MSGWICAIDFGTSFTAAAVMAPGEEPELVEFDSGDAAGATTTMPSTVFRTAAGATLAGFAAEASVLSAPDQAELTPKARLHGGDVVEQLGDESVPVVALVGAVLRETYDRVCDRIGGRPDHVALTYPVSWTHNGPRWRALIAAAGLAGIDVTTTLTEPEAAAHHVAAAGAPIADGETFAIYDLGGGTCDIAVMRREGAQLATLATVEDEIGGELFDEHLYLELLAQLERKHGAGAQRLRGVRDDPRRASLDDRDALLCAADAARSVRRAKEELSRRKQCPVLIPPPVGVELTTTRKRLDELVKPELGRSAQLLADCVAQAAANGRRERSKVYLVGGASQMPAVFEHVKSAVGRAPILADRPKGAIALGAVRELAQQPSGAPVRRGRGRSSIALDKQVHAPGVRDARCFGDRVLVLSGAESGQRLSRLDPAAGRATAELELPGGGYEQIACGAAGVAVTGPRRLVLLSHELEPLAERLEPAFVRVGGDVAWVGYLAEGGRDRGRNRALRTLRARTLRMSGASVAVVDDVHLGEVEVGGKLKPGPPPWTVSGPEGDDVDGVVVTVQRARKTRLGTSAWSQDCICLNRDGGAVREFEIKERPWTVQLLRHQGQWISLSGREPAQFSASAQPFARGPCSVAIGVRTLKTTADERVEMTLCAVGQEVFVLSRNSGKAKDGGNWWALDRCEPGEAVPLHRAETATAAWTGTDRTGAWFFELSGDEPRTRGLHVGAHGEIETTDFERGRHTRPLGIVGDRVYALETQPKRPPALVSYAWSR